MHYELSEVYIIISDVFCKTVAESLHKCTLSIFSFSSSTIITFNLEAKTAAYYSSLGVVIVLFLAGANLFLFIK